MAGGRVLALGACAMLAAVSAGSSGGSSEPPEPVRAGTATTISKAPRVAAPSPRIEPARAPRPSSILIPRIGAAAEIAAVSLDETGAIEVPPPDVAGWYTGSAPPGRIGPSVIIGHVDSKTGPAVFYRLSALGSGDTIEIARDDGSRVSFRVTRVTRHRRTSMPAEIYGVTSAPVLRLITCGGPYDRESGYRDNVVVWAEQA